MARKINSVYVKIAQTYRAWERKYPGQPMKLRVAAFDRIADGFLAAHMINEKAVALIENHVRASR